MKSFVNERTDCILSTVCPEKRDQNVFRNIFYDTRAILMKFGTLFPE